MAVDQCGERGVGRFGVVASQKQFNELLVGHRPDSAQLCKACQVDRPGSRWLVNQALRLSFRTRENPSAFIIECLVRAEIRFPGSARVEVCRWTSFIATIRSSRSYTNRCRRRRGHGVAGARAQSLCDHRHAGASGNDGRARSPADRHPVQPAFARSAAGRRDRGGPDALCARARLFGRTRARSSSSSISRPTISSSSASRAMCWASNAWAASTTRSPTLARA